MDETEVETNTEPRTEPGSLKWEWEEGGEIKVETSSVTETPEPLTFPCDSCNLFFLQEYELDAHMQAIHLQQSAPKLEDFTCKTSHEEEGDSSEGMAIHTGETPLPCALETESVVKKEGEVNCLECGEGFESEHSMLLHINHVHVNKKPFACHLCTQSYWQLQHYNSHVKFHEGLTIPPHFTFACNICKEKFSKSDAIIQHMQTHKDVKTLVCHVCGSKYSNQVCFERHLENHKPGKEKMKRRRAQFMCEYCGLKFKKERDGLEKHVKDRHSDAPKPKCKVCGKEFQAMSTVLKHAKEHERQAKVERWMKHLKEAHTTKGTEGCEECKMLYMTK